MARSTALLVSALLVLAAAGCGGEVTRQSGEGAARTGDTVARPREAPTMSVAELEEFASVDVPAGVEDVEIYTETGIDTVAFARFPVDRDQLDAFLEASAFADPLEEGSPLNVTPPESLGWDVDAIGRRAALEDTRDWVTRQVVVDLDDPDRPVVYLQAFTT